MTGANLKNSSNDEGMETGTGWEIKVWPMDGWQDGMEDDMNVCGEGAPYSNTVSDYVTYADAYQLQDRYS